ncbi:MAG: type VI secretion system tip protein VgrG [Deltaproteobacteria bacterium]|jgi:type VI secretion system secreted protein VgrG|nr:type VI secretion system tip protein VgrG [Deltaproteobacteria bacterium]MBW2531245.1 type VI secretion system tip protein VgrG [Deltaproteobacteria bacterium]
MNETELELRLESKGFDTDNLRIHQLHGVERMGRIFEVNLQVVALGERMLNVDETVGADASVTIAIGGDPVRHFHGLVTQVTELPVENENWAVYRLTLSPRLWQATLVEMPDVHVEASVPQVIERMLSRIDMARGSDFELNLTGTYAPRELIVQYGETDLAFVSRLCEHLGIFFYFAHQEDGTTVEFGDHSGAYLPIGDDEAVAFHARGERQGVFEIRLDQTLIPSTYVCRDYNDQTPALELQLDHGLDEGFAGGIIEYGTHFLTPAEGEAMARVRAEERLATRQVFSGLSNEPRFAPGYTFELDGHPTHSRRLLLLEVEHQASQEVAGWGEGTEHRYENRFTAIPAELCYRPPRTTPIPRIHGFLSGVIDTWQGQIERHARIDQQGRYLVKFLFDTAAPGERKASSPVRMMQASAGTGYGVHFPLKPGVEVLIGFVGGNPDRPVILGAVPNPITPTPVDASVSTKSRIKTRSGILIEFEDADRG